MLRTDGRGRRARAVETAAAVVAAALLAVSLFGFAAGVSTGTVGGVGTEPAGSGGTGTAAGVDTETTAGLDAGTTATGDRSAAIAPSSHTVETDPGEEFELEVLLHSDGGHGGEGVESVALIAQYHPDYLEITDVERGPWLEQGPETDVRVERALAHDRGTAVLEQRRDPPAEGATGNAVLATLTVAVAADAPPAEATISFDESRVELVRQFPLPVYAQEATVEIDGGGDPVPSYEHPDPATIETAPPPADDGDGDDSDGTDTESTTGDDESDGDGTEGDEQRDDERQGDVTDDPVPGVAVPIAATVVVGTALDLRRRYR